MLVELERVAEEELAEATAYYQAQRPGLGFEFMDDLERALQRIRDFPHAWPSVSRGSRRCRLGRFPYGLVYQIRGDRAVVIAVMHLHRQPNYWQRREM